MKIEYQTGTLNLSDLGPLNAANSSAFREEARAALREGVTNVNIDLSQTRQVDSSGLGALIALQKTVGARGGTIRILRPTPIVYQILELTRLHRVFEIVRD